MDDRTETAGDMMVGAAVIASYLGMRRRQVYHAAEFGYLPLFRVGSLICARKTTLARWIEEREAAALTSAQGPRSS